MKWKKNDSKKETSATPGEGLDVQDVAELDTGASGEKSRLKREIFSEIRLLVIVFLVCLFLTKVVFVNAVIPSSSMENTIMTSSRVIGNRLSYISSDPKRGDIVVFHYPVDPDTLYIKRVIGLPGETVTIEDGNVYIDGELLEEDYLPEEWVVGNDGYTFEVPEDCYLMLGDNRNVSVDARYWAQEAIDEGLADTEEEAEEYTYVEKDEIVAKALFVYWPLTEWKWIG